MLLNYEDEGGTDGGDVWDCQVKPRLPSHLTPNLIIPHVLHHHFFTVAFAGQSLSPAKP